MKEAFPEGDLAYRKRKTAEAAMTRCASGKHELTDENLFIDVHNNRRCRACAQERIDARAREKEQALENRLGSYLD